jgi:hypothetical protein
MNKESKKGEPPFDQLWWMIPLYLIMSPFYWILNKFKKEK